MQHMTEEQARQWASDGYLVVEGALNPDEVAFFNHELDRVRQQPGYEPASEPGLNIGHYNWVEHAADTADDGFMDRRDLLGYDQAFVDLVDRPNVFDLVADIMGANIALSMTQAIVRPATNRFPGYTHTDGGEALREIRVTESSRPLAMKAMYLLTDVTERNSGNLTVFPGSHLRPFPLPVSARGSARAEVRAAEMPFQSSIDQRTPVLTPDSPGAHQLMGKAGDCYLFSHALWHGPARNTTNRARKTLLYNYAQLFMRQYDFQVTPELNARLSPRQRRLLGDLGYSFRPGSYFYVPLDQEQIIYNH